MAAFAALVLLVCVSRVSTQPTPPPPPPGQPELISNRPGFCPERPNVNGSRSCVTEANCTNTQKCCRFPTGLTCAEAVITDYSAAFYVSGILADEEATRLLHDAIRAAIGPAASDLIIEIYNEGACAQVHVEVKLNGSASTADAAIHKIEENGISIPSLNQSPFTVSSTDEACPVLYNYETHFFIIGIDYESLHSTALQAFIESVIENTVDEWYIEVDQSGPCAKVYLYASANATQEVALNVRLAGLETRGPVNITFPVVGTRALNFTTNRLPACQPPPNTTESPYSNECGEGRAMCRGVKKCYALSQMCDGQNDCGDGSDEENCKTSTADCTNSRDYCKNGGRCEYSEYYGETRCTCPAPFSGDQCEIDVCSQMGTSVCSGQGKCIGNLYMDQICNCSTGYKGVFCQEAGTENLTDCQRQRRFNMFLLNALRNGNVSVPAAFLNGKTILQQLMDFDYHTIEVPKCWEDAQRLGKYHSVCSYNVSYMSQVPECVCTNGEGLENGWDYVDGDCRVYGGGGGDVCASNPCGSGGVCQPVFGGDFSCVAQDRPSNVSTNRQGDCPRWTKEAEMGVAVYQCTYDTDCKTDLRAKCCKVGAGSQCVAPVYGDSQFNISVTISGSWDDAFTNRNSSQFRELANVLRTIFGGSSMLRGFRGFDIKEIRGGSIMLSVQLTGAADLGYNEIMALLEDLKSQRIQLGGNIRTITNTAHVAAGACARMNCGPGVCLNRTDRVMCVCPDTHMGMQCEKQDPCLQTVCMNSGTCNSRTDTAAMSFEFFCQCPVGFAGRACEVSVCDTFSVTGRVCGQQGTCVGDLFTGHLCSCLADRTGTFCETAGKESLTDCQRRARLSKHAQALFQQGKSLPSGGLTAAGLKELLLAMRIEWLPLYKCEQNGSFTLAIDRLSVRDMRTTKRMCVSVEGFEEQGCNSKVCQSLEMYDGICQNGGQCVGDIYGQLCDCTATQHHGAVCTEPGEQTGTPECMRRQDLANLTLRVLNGTGTIGSFPAALVSGLLRQLMSEIGLTEIWMPRCTVDGEYTRVGCEYNVSNILSRECFCVDGNQQRDPNARLPDCLPVVMPPVKPGCNCSVGEKCLQGLRPGVFACSCDPEEDGECRQPQWYCGGMANCSLGERCVHKKVCDDRQNCQPIRSYCVPMNTPDVCDRQPCKHGGSCVAADENTAGFVCQCPAEFGGKFCEINLNVCSVVPSALCDRCIGDLMMGVLCECPLGRAGLECQHPANTKCERQRALYTDVMGIIKGTYPVRGYSVEEARRFVRAVMATVEANFLPMPNCTADGSFAPVQCDMTLGTMVKQCHCVNVNGHPLSSNVMAYSGYPPCTAPFSPNLTAELLCGSMGSVCQNGGRCVGNLLNSTMCQCPSTHTGIFCQNALGAGEKPDEPMTLCELALEVYDLMRGMASGADQARSQMPYLQAIRSVLFPAGNLPDVMIKAKCNNDGQFDQVQCTYNITTDRPLHCYCMGPKGVLMNTMTNVTVRPRCDDVPKCPTFASCTLKCEHGLTLDMQGCEICRCRDPCEGLCGRDPAVRCVVERREDCKRPDWDGPCTAGVCRLRKKPGMCPVSIAANLTSLTTMQNMTASSCDVQCLDDADCPSDHKCCGLCGTKCVPPFEEKGCQSMKESAQQHLAILRQLHQTIVEAGVNLDTLPAFIRMQLEIAEDMNAVWVPECDAEGFFMPRQCMTVVSNKTDIANGDTDMEGGMMDDEDMMDDVDETSMEEMEKKMQKFGGCFCVDRFGQHIKGTEGDSADEVTCEVKPGECPFLQPNGTMDHDCDGDFDCQGPLKCCSDGLDATMCVLPAFALRPAEVASIDETMMKICDLVPDICGANSTCVRNWETDGRICACKQNMYGSLCTSSDRPAAQLTPCQERQVMVDLLMQGPPSLLEKIERLIYTTSNATKTVVLQYTSCDKEGRFEPMQCEINTDGEMQACYCVNKEGRRLPGTTAPPEEAKKMKCAAVNPCDVGTPLHHLNGSLVKCMHGHGVCAPDYHCEAGYFGELFCCRDRFSKADECDIPANPGFDCPYYTDNGDAVKKEIMEQRFVFNSRTRQCQAFEYKGCSNARMNFNNKPSCEARCLRKEHLGQCPTFEVPIRAVCTDSCHSDADCEEDQKCCASSCGRRCVRALNEEGEQCEIGQPLVDTSTNQQAGCSSSRPCPAGYMCNKGICCPQRQVEVCKQPVQSGPCYAYFTRYFFNSTSMRCQQFVYGGCNGNDNNFETMEECCNTCAERGKCKEGTCPKLKPVLTSSCKSRCQSDGDCPRNQICCASGCGGFSCVIPRSEKDEEYMCKQRLQGYHQQRRLAGDANCFLKYMPRCAEDGSWQEQQCSDKLGICWCVTRHGNEIAGTRTFGVAQCQFATNAERQSADRDVETKEGGDSEQCEVCPNGQPVQCCPQELCLQVCAADPTAVCRINPCGGCKAQFFNAKNETVNCTAGLTKCQRERMAASLARHQHAIVAVAASQDTNPMMTEIRGTSSASDYQVSYVQGGVPLMCHLRASSGNCKAYMPQWFYNVTSQKCEVFLYGMCGGNENQFNSPAECYERCNSVKSPCAVVRCGTGPCQLTYDTDCFHGPCNVQPKCAPEPRSGHKMLGVYVPECTRNGTFAYRQCQNGFCWCVNANGEYSNGFTSEPDGLTCDEKGPVGSFSLPTCPDGLSRPNPNCVNRCRDAVCPGKPFARCVVNLCSNDCSTSFVDLAGSAVQCTADDQEETCKAHIFDKSQASCPSKASCSGKSPLTCGQEDTCDDVVCKNNPCAICFTDPCSGQVYFKDRLNSGRYNLDQCDKLVHKSCELRMCEVMAQNDLARDNDTMLAMPICEPDGSYRAHQKLEDNVDVCVDSFGEFVEVLDPSKGCKKDPLVKVKFSLKYNGNFDQVAHGKEDKIKDAFLRNVEKFGITPQMVLSFAVRPGSIIVDAVIGQAKNMPAEFDLAAITPLIQQQAAAGQMDMTIDGQTLMLATDNSAVQFEAFTASQVQPPDEPSTTPVPGTDADSAGLSTGGKIAIAVVFSALGVVLLAVLAYCCCCKKRRGMQADYIDSTYDKPAETHPPKGTSVAVTNNTYDMYDNLKPTTGGPATNKGFQADDNVDDDHYVQVRM